jgi:hypothetical protein
MINTTKFFILFALILTSCSARPSPSIQPEEESVRQVLIAYKDAVLKHQGDSAALVVNRNTLEYFGGMKTMALEANEQEVRQLTPLHRMMVLSFRHRIPANELRAMTPEGVFIHSINQGWVGKNSVLDSDVGKVQVFGDNASAEFLKAGKPTPLKLRFTKEDGKWKIDFTSVFPLSDQALSMLIKKKEVDEDTFIISLIESVSGKKVSPSIWQPLGK